MFLVSFDKIVQTGENQYTKTTVDGMFDEDTTIKEMKEWMFEKLNLSEEMKENFTTIDKEVIALTITEPCVVKKEKK